MMALILVAENLRESRGAARLSGDLQIVEDCGGYVPVSGKGPEVCRGPHVRAENDPRHALARVVR